MPTPLPYPSLPESQGGDETTFSPGKTTHAILASKRGTQNTKRIETDDAGNLHVSVSAVDYEPVGVWSYYAGVSGTVNVTGKVIGITALTVNLAATVSINGGPNIPLPQFASVDLTPKRILVDPTVVFTNTDSYLIEVIN